MSAILERLPVQQDLQSEDVTSIGEFSPSDAAKGLADFYTQELAASVTFREGLTGNQSIEDNYLTTSFPSGSDTFQVIKAQIGGNSQLNIFRTDSDGVTHAVLIRTELPNADGEQVDILPAGIVYQSSSFVEQKDGTVKRVVKQETNAKALPGIAIEMQKLRPRK
jgi:hypothetical protein